MKRLFQICLIVLFSLAGKAQNIPYDSLMIKIDEFESIKAYDQAKELIIQQWQNYPQNWFELSKELIFLNEKIGCYKNNLTIFNKAHQKGYFYFIHPRMKEYQPYLNFPGFDSISKNDLQLLAEANRKSSTIFEIQMPNNYNGDNAYPVIFIFHGGGKNLDEVKQHWNGAYIDRNFIKVYLQSYRHFDSKTYGWGNQDKKLDEETKAIFNQVLGNYKVDSSMVIVCGISAGAGAALDLSMRRIIPSNGALLICPPLITLLREKKFDLTTNHDLNVYMVGGENDHFLEQQKQMAKLFEQLKINYKHIILEGMGHQYPENETKYLTDFFDWLNLKN